VLATDDLHVIAAPATRADVTDDGPRTVMPARVELLTLIEQFTHV